MLIKNLKKLHASYVNALTDLDNVNLVRDIVVKNVLDAKQLEKKPGESFIWITTKIVCRSTFLGLISLPNTIANTVQEFAHMEEPPEDLHKHAAKRGVHFTNLLTGVVDRDLKRIEEGEDPE